jgi:hypothetical protein
VQLKADLKVSLCILSAPNVMAVIILARSNQYYPSATMTVSGVMKFRISDSLP